MSEMVRYAIVLISILLLSVVFVMVMRSHADAGDNPFHRIWNLIRYAYLKAAIGIGYGMEALEHGKQEKEKAGCTVCAGPSARMAEVHRKEERLAGLKDCGRNGNIKKDCYKMKILK